MILSTTVNNGTTGLLTKIRGSLIGSGSNGSNSAGSKTFAGGQTLGSDGLGVVAGDILHIIGVGEFVVSATPLAAATSITVETFIAPSTSSQAYQILRGGLSESQIYDIQGNAAGGHVVLYDPFAPRRSKGFLTNTAAVTGIGTSYAIAKKVTLNWTGTLVDDLASEPYDQVKISHIELAFSNASSVTAVEFALTWDAAGDVVALGPTTAAIAPLTGLTTAAKRSLSASFGEQTIDFVNGSAESGKKLYLHIKLTGGTGDLDTARLYWFA
jgi:hypothetical protein